MNTTQALWLLGELAEVPQGDEPVGHLKHALQCADIARSDGAPDYAVVAALLHDAGKAFHDDEHHGVLAAELLRPHVPGSLGTALLWHSDGLAHYEATGREEPVYVDDEVVWRASWDARAKDPDYPTPHLGEFIPLLKEVLG